MMSEKKEDLEKALDILMQQEREKDRAPTPRELLAYYEGEMTEAEKSRFLDRLVLDKSAVQALLDIEKFPGEDDAAQMSEDELEAVWVSFKQMEKSGSPTKPGTPKKMMNPLISALAACFLLATVGLSFWVGALQRINRALSSPTLETGFSDVFFDEAHRREPQGSARPTLSLSRRVQTLGLHLSEKWDPYDTYIVEIQDPSGRTVFSGQDQADDEKMLVLTLVRDYFTKPGQYKVLLYGIENDESSFLESVSFTVPPN